MNEVGFGGRATAALDGCAAMIASLRRPGARGLRAASSPEGIRDDVQRRLDALCAIARAEGMTGAAVEAMLLPLVALADEIALGQRDTLASVWADRPLQMHYFRENVAGELFFSQMEAARREPSTSPLVLRAYFLGLCLGFRGRYALHDDPTELDRTRELLRDDLERRGLLRAGERLSPRAERPATTTMGSKRRRGAAWAAIGAASMVLGIALLVQMFGYFGDVERLMTSLREAMVSTGVAS
jgi:type VI secretion system protein ImpK